MSARENSIYLPWARAKLLETKQNTASGSSATYQATGDDVGRLHVFVSLKDVYLEGGTGTSVTATSGTPWTAGQPYYFRPISGRESLGYAAVSGSFASGSEACVALVE